ncbi:acyl-CoA/acyl-ACP dehydrogenase [Lusitaniella coriacea LEGE 07157]|uniref:Acyl-CoA/acyl-ACP dehydrogenase n=1 Tax=Lusitaniella coriacea LEGE 07157 TaxID=945747 RepID=A0A8J7ITS9_9CYAN|nr:acyl-CoA dehydrogenase family protein [Lusitaniella coriacea]MBE9117047.1 acyl-CoA/acyl-ACP dehydrogenase [Lusitaniella coriacea LEGE 07157]
MTDGYCLHLAESYLQESVAPHAGDIDAGFDALQLALQGLGDRALLALKVPKQWQGKGLSPLEFHHFQETVASYSGALAFLQTQHQTAGALLANGTNEALKHAYLPLMGTGEVLVGVGFSHLRRQGKPTLTALEVDSGYELTGNVPWITGFGFFHHFIIGATLPTGEAVYGLMPLENLVQPAGGTLQFSPPMQLAAMESTNTVSARLEGWFLEKDRLITIEPRDRIREKDRKNVLNASSFALGCAKAGLTILQTAYHKKQFPFLLEAHNALEQELENCRRAILENLQTQTLNFEQRLSLRAEAIHLAQRCAQAAVTASSGAANGKSHPAQRVYQEALMFAVVAQTPAVMEATLARLLSPFPQRV